VPQDFQIGIMLKISHYPLEIGVILFFHEKGCGAFGGNKYLKSILQLIVASYYDRDMVYTTFSDSEFENELKSFYQFLIKNDIKLSQLFNVMINLYKSCDMNQSRFSSFSWEKVDYYKIIIKNLIE
jgi:hypothetical protein